MVLLRYLSLNQILSLILGVIAGILSYPYLFARARAEPHGPDSNIVRKEIHQGPAPGELGRTKCYKYEPIPYLCGVSRSN